MSRFGLSFVLAIAWHFPCDVAQPIKSCPSERDSGVANGQGHVRRCLLCPSPMTRHGIGIQITPGHSVMLVSLALASRIDTGNIAYQFRWGRGGGVQSLEKLGAVPHSACSIENCGATLCVARATFWGQGGQRGGDLSIGGYSSRADRSTLNEPGTDVFIN